MAYSVAATDCRSSTQLFHPNAGVLPSPLSSRFSSCDCGTSLATANAEAARKERKSRMLVLMFNLQSGMLGSYVLSTAVVSQRVRKYILYYIHAA